MPYLVLTQRLQLQLCARVGILANMRPLLEFLDMMISPNGEQAVEVSNIPSHFSDVIRRINSVDGVYRCISTDDYIDLWTAEIVTEPECYYRVSKYYYEDTLMVRFTELVLEKGKMVILNDMQIQPV